MWRRWRTWIFVCVLGILIVVLGWYLFIREPAQHGGTLVRALTGVCQHA